MRARWWLCLPLLAPRAPGRSGHGLAYRLGLCSVAGISVVEVVVSVALLGSVVAIAGPVMVSSMRSGETVQNQSRTLDEVRLAVSRIDREVRSAECISAPAQGAYGSTLTFTTHAGNAGEYEVAYAVTSGTLTRTVDGATTVVSEGLVASGREFTHTGEVGQHETVEIAFTAGFDDAPRSIETTITGRNTWSAC